MSITNCYLYHMDKTQTLSAALDHLIRKNRTATQRRIAEHVGITQPYVSDLKNGTKPGPRDTWEKIAEYFKMTYDDFFSLGRGLAEKSGDVVTDVIDAPQQSQEGGSDPHMERFINSLNREIKTQAKYIELLESNNQNLQEQLQNLQQPQALSGASGNQKTGS